MIDLKEYQEGYNKLVELCNQEGHKKPNEANNFCNYCFRSLILDKSPQEKEVEGLLNSRKDLPLMDQPLDASYLNQYSKKGHEFMKDKDYLEGLSKYIKSLKK